MSLSTSLQGYVQVTPFDELEEDRYIYLNLAQAEPNPGLPDSEGALFISAIDGTRTFTTTPRLSGLNFKAQSLTEFEGSPRYFLVLKGDPTDGIDDSVGYALAEFEEQDTLFTVTQPSRGVGHDSTDQRLTMFGLVVTDSAQIGGDLTVLGNLRIEGTQTILNTETVTIEDKSLVIGQGSPDALTADSSGIIIDGTGEGLAAASMLYRNATDTFNFSRGIIAPNRSQFDSVVADTLDVENIFLGGFLNFDSTSTQDIIKAAGALNTLADEQRFRTFGGLDIARFALDSIQLSTITTITDSANLEGKIFATDVPPQEGTVQILFRRTSDGLIMEGDIDIANVDKVSINDTDSDATHYLMFSYANGGQNGFDSAYGDFDDLTYNPSTNLLSLVNLDASGVTTLDSTTVAGDLQINTNDTVEPSGRLLDSAGRSFVIYDSAGNLLWGNNGASAGNLGGPQAAVLFLNDLADVSIDTPLNTEVLKYDASEGVWVNGTDGGGGGGGIALTDLDAITNTPSGTGSLVYNELTGDFTYTPPVIPDISTLTSLDLTDTPAAYGTAGQALVVNATATGLEFAAVGGGGGGSAVEIQDEASSLTTDVSLINFVGAGVTATNSGSSVTVTIPGGGGGGSGNAFTTIASGSEDNIIASSPTDTLIFTAGTNIGIEQDAGTKAVTISYTGSAPSATLARATEAEITANLASNNSGNIEFGDIGVTYSLFSVQVSHACRVRIYTDTTARTLDAARPETQDPAEGAGVIAEFVATSADTFKITPAVIGWVDASSQGGATTVPVAVTNKSGGAAQVTVTITALKMES